MPVEFDDNTDDSTDGGTSGKGLRSQLESTLAQNKALAEELRSLKAERVVGSFDLVTPEDLEGVAAENLEERAQEIQTERTALREQVARDLLKAQGVDEAELDTAVNTLLAGAEDSTQALARVRRTAEVGGTPSPLVNPENLHGRDAIAAGVKG